MGLCPGAGVGPSGLVVLRSRAAVWRLVSGDGCSVTAVGCLVSVVP